MKVELKHIAPYLPYGLRIHVLNDIDNVYETETLKGLTNDGFETEYGHYEFGHKDKPILRPLSDLTKEIDHNGERFVPIDRLQTETNWCDAYDEWLDCTHGMNDRMIETCPYEISQNLFEWHFDVFSLIDSGLAVSINEI